MLLITLLFFKNIDSESKHFYTAIRAKCLLRENALNTFCLIKNKTKQQQPYKTTAQKKAVRHDMARDVGHA